MSRQKKPLIRWIGEALLIFLSVLGAFYFDNLRDEWSQKDLYVRHLNDFKRDLEENQGKFAYELSNTYDARSGRGYIKGNSEKYDQLYQVMLSPSRALADSLITFIDDGGIFGVTPWIFESPQYEKLNSEFYSFIKTDTLRMLLQLHHRNDQSRVNVKNAINNYVRRFEGIADQLNPREGGSRNNQAVLFGNESVNTIRRLSSYYDILKGMTENAKRDDSLLLIQVERELEVW